MAKELGISRVAMPTNGNAGAAMAAYSRRGGMEAYVFCPEDTPDINVREIALQGAKVWKVNGYIDDCGKIVGEGKEPMGWFDTSTLKEPYRIEGKKTMDALNSDQKTLNGGTLTAYRKFRKNWLDGAIIGLKSEGPSKSSNWPSDVECDNGIIQAIDTVLVPGAYEGPR